MSVSGISGSSSYQAFQVASQRNNGQAVNQTPNAPQRQQEESSENAAVKGQEANQGAEDKKANSINIYA